MQFHLNVNYRAGTEQAAQVIKTFSRLHLAVNRADAIPGPGDLRYY
ncbi:MAG: hypothetical protein LBU61_06905 [Coriobacteriales bacterium]|jgi:hypothetical protein|nr:hypothetical protein [Coriobacteriales bacterium]